MNKKIKVVILGATGSVGQRFVQLLENHPWFEISGLAASEKSAGQAYQDVVTWKMSTPIPVDVASMKVQLPDPKKFKATIAFSGLDASVAGEVEEAFAKKGYVVISNSKNHRMDDDVPLLIPEVNEDHLALVDIQKKRWKSGGYIITNPNCTTVGLTMVLKPLHDAFGVKKVLVTTMQALSGAGYPGVASLDILDNVYPFIGGEEHKVETEPLKLLGSLRKNNITHASIAISATCNRVAVRDGHLEAVSLEFEKKPTIAQIKNTLKSFISSAQKLKLPFAPEFPIILKEEDDRPQPFLDRNLGNGMSVVVGRIRPSNVLDFHLTLLVHNTIRGAAGAAILNAELLYKKGYLNGKN